MTHCCRPRDFDSFLENDDIDIFGCRRHRDRRFRRRRFNLVDSDPDNGDIVSPFIKKIVLTFNRNVTSSRVWGNNRLQIDLWRGDKKVKIRVKKGADPNTILIVPVHPLLPGKTYKIRIKAALMASNGQTLGRCILIVFHTDCIFK